MADPILSFYNDMLKLLVIFVGNIFAVLRFSIIIFVN